MKILHVIPSYIPAYRYGGPVKGVHELCKALVKRNLDISVFTTDADWEKRLDVPLEKPQNMDGVKVTYFPVRTPKKYYYSAGLAAAIKAQVSDFDLVHIHAVFLYTTYIAAHWCRKKHIPYIINPFGALDPAMIRLKNPLVKNIYIAAIEKHNIKNAVAIHAASQYEKSQFLSLGFKTPVVIVPRGINPEDYLPPRQMKALGEAYPKLAGKRVILFLGRIHFKKGLDLLAAAFRKVIENRQDAYLVIAGPSEEGYATRVKRLFQKFGLIERVLFTGLVLGDEKLSAFYGSDLFVLPSYGENFGIAALEAMACKLPVVITSRVGLYPEIEEYNAGIVTECASDQIAGAIIKLLDDGNLRRSMGENGRRLVYERFMWSQIADKMIEVYKDIAKTKH